MSIGSSVSPFSVAITPINNFTSTTELSTIVDDIDSNPHCPKDALTNSYGWFVQFILATLAFMLLIVKRFCEPRKRRRSWLVWMYDTSKQGFGAALLHFVNIFLASEFKGDPCTWYIISFLLDSTVGLAFVWAGIRFSVYVGQKYKYPTLIFGDYGRPPSTRAWGHQCAVYCSLMAFAKILITALMRLPYWTVVRDAILAPIYSPQARVVVVVLVIPFFVNALIFWVTDNFLMLKIKSSIDSSTISSSVDLSHGDKVTFLRHRTDSVSEADVLITHSSPLASTDEPHGGEESDVTFIGGENLMGSPFSSPTHDSSLSGDDAVFVHITPEHHPRSVVMGDGGRNDDLISPFDDVTYFSPNKK